LPYSWGAQFLDLETALSISQTTNTSSNDPASQTPLLNNQAPSDPAATNAAAASGDAVPDNQGTGEAVPGNPDAIEQVTRDPASTTGTSNTEAPGSQRPSDPPLDGLGLVTETPTLQASSSQAVADATTNSPEANSQSLNPQPPLSPTIGRSFTSHL